MSISRPIVLLTRPQAGSERFAESLRKMFGDAIDIVIAPLQRIEWIDLQDLTIVPKALIFTSQNGVFGWNRDEKHPHCDAYCVGPQTTALAQEFGLNAIDCGGDAEAVTETVLAERTVGPVVHYRGEHGIGSIAEYLNRAGIETIERVCYRQVVEEPDEIFALVFNSERPVIAPLFSPRSAAIFQRALPVNAVPWLAVISANAGERVDAKRQQKMIVAKAPNALAMLDAVKDILDRL